MQEARAFTLLELLVVLLILSLLSALAMPRLSALYDSMQFAQQREEVLSRINALPYHALREQRNLELRDFPTQTELPLELPAHWRVYAPVPIHYHANGVCEGGTIHLSYGKRQSTIRLEAPFCMVH